MKPKKLPYCIVMMSKQQWAALNKALRAKTITLPGKKLDGLTKELSEKKCTDYGRERSGWMV